MSQHPSYQHVDTRPTFESLFRKTLMSQAQFARVAHVDASIIRKARQQQNISELSALKIAAALSQLLGTTYNLEDIQWPYSRGNDDD